VTTSNYTCFDWSRTFYNDTKRCVFEKSVFRLVKDHLESHVALQFLNQIKRSFKGTISLLSGAKIALSFDRAGGVSRGGQGGRPGRDLRGTPLPTPPSTLNPETFKPQASTRNTHSTLDSQAGIFEAYPNPSTLIPRPSSLNPHNTSTLLPQP